MKDIIHPNELLELYPSKTLVLLDVRTNPKKYAESHLKDAIWVDIETELAHKSDNAAQGGRHPLPSVEEFCSTLGRWGISPAHHVVAYDDISGANAAARVWWMLKALGHPSVQVLDGGFQAAIAAGFPTNAETPQVESIAPYPADAWLLPTYDMEEVGIVAQKTDDYMVVDVRDSARFKGYVEPIDLIAGHIPGAVNMPFKDNLDEQGFFLSPEQLKENYTTAFGKRPAQNVVVHCGSGITACHTLLALSYAGLQIPNLYVGSWSEWSRNGREIGRED